MMAETLQQALEGISFPCDRARLIEYARQFNLPPRALAALEEIPQRQYRDLDEVFTVLPARPLEMVGGMEDIQRQAVEEAGEWWQQGWRMGLTPLELTVQCLRAGAETWPQWIRLGQRLWFPWMK
ncbi:MAG: DUF2795 domain-containing protein [Magnetospirillum sp.]|nr:DUF2795 domain-containing protein [Magnetospirillum sp.]